MIHIVWNVDILLSIDKEIRWAPNLIETISFTIATNNESSILFFWSVSCNFMFSSVSDSEISLIRLGLSSTTDMVNKNFP